MSENISLYSLIPLFLALSIAASLVGGTYVVNLYAMFFIFLIAFHRRFFDGKHYLLKVISVLVLTKLSLYLHFILSDDFVWREGVFLEEDSVWYMEVVRLIEVSVNELGYFNGISKLASQIGNGFVFSFLLAAPILLFGDNIQNVVMYVPLYNLFYTLIILILLNRIVLLIINDHRVAILALSVVSFSLSFQYYSFFMLKEIFLSMMSFASMYFLVMFLVLGRRYKYFFYSIMCAMIVIEDRYHFGLLLMVTISYVWLAGLNKIKSNANRNASAIFVGFIIMLLFYDKIYFAYDYVVSYISLSIDSTSILLYPVNLIKILVTPLPFNASHMHDIKAFLRLDFFVQVLLVFYSMLGFFVVYRRYNMYSFLFFPLAAFIAVYAIYDPGMMRHRTVFIPYFSFFSAVGFYYTVIKVGRYRVSYLAKRFLRENLGL